MGSGNARLVTRYGGDIAVDMTASPSQPTVGKPFDIAYTLTGKDGLPVTANKLQVTHEHLMHLIVVSKDLKQFAHIHPEDTGGGRYVVSGTLPVAGDYLLYNEFVSANGTTQLERHSVASEAAPTPEPPVLMPDLGKTQVVDDLSLVMTATNNLRRKLPVTFTLLAQKDGQPVTDLEPYLGAACHVIVISQDTRQFAHTHGDVAGGAMAKMDMGNMVMSNMPPPPEHFGPSVQFTHIFMQAGMYRVWVQFTYKGKVVTVAYNVNVAK
jgi:hypothetical protein